LIFSGGFTVFFFVVGPGLIDLLTSVEDVRRAARVYLPWVVVLPIISVWSFQLDGIFIKIAVSNPALVGYHDDFEAEVF